MNESPYSDGLVEWAKRAEYDLTRADGAWLFASPGGELRDYLRKLDGLWTLTHAERGGWEHFTMAAAEMADVERYLTVDYGDAIRSGRRLPMIWTAFEIEMVCPGYQITVPEKGKLALSKADGGVRIICAGGRNSAMRAVEFSWVADVSMDELRASYLDPDGLPLFPGLWIGPEGGQPPWMPKPGVEQTWVPPEGETLLDESPFSAETIQWAGLAGFHLVAIDGGCALVTKNWSERHCLRRGRDRWTLTWANMDLDEFLEVSAPDLLDVERCVTVRLGAVIRKARRWGDIDRASKADMVRPGFQVPILAPGETGLIAPEGDLRAVFGGGTRFPPAWFTWIADAPLDQLRASYLDPGGLPLFPELWIGPEGRKPR